MLDIRQLRNINNNMKHGICPAFFLTQLAQNTPQKAKKTNFLAFFGFFLTF
jgi:hypothetical protein